MSTKIKTIPYRKMPINIDKKLTVNDYRYALFHPSGFMRGIFEVIHMNINYPEWNNIILVEDIKDEVVIYTEDGWKREKFENAWKQINREYIDCFTYFYANKEKIFPCLINKNKSQ